jgi:hypothetical protein
MTWIADHGQVGDHMQLERLLEAINFTGVVSGLTHDFYRYPARFSPLVARAAIECFTKPGDTILDPFSGGATSLVEGLALGRHTVGMDISRLAVFLARVKTLLLQQDERDAILDRAIEVTSDLSPRRPVKRHWERKEAGYQENLPQGTASPFPSPFCLARPLRSLRCGLSSDRLIWSLHQVAPRR